VIWGNLGPPFKLRSPTSYILHLPSRCFDEASPEHVESFVSTPSMKQ